MVLNVLNLLPGGRNVPELEKAVSKVRGSNKDLGKVICLDLDLSSLTSVRRFAEAFKALRLPLHVLVNNGKFCGTVQDIAKKENEFHQRFSYCLFCDGGLFLFYFILLFFKIMKEQTDKQNYKRNYWSYPE